MKSQPVPIALGALAAALVAVVAGVAAVSASGPVRGILLGAGALLLIVAGALLGVAASRRSRDG